MSIINLTETTRINVDQRQYVPEYFDKGGELVRNPSTGEMVEKQSKWVSSNTFHSTLESAIKYLARVQLLKQDEYSSLKEYLDKVLETEKELMSSLKGI